MSGERLFDYKNYKRSGQERRRDELLNNQERNRNKLLDLHRRTITNFNADESDEFAEADRGGEKSLGKMLMLSEWFTYPPEDFESSWSFKFCPEGRRCVVFARKGKTIAVAKNGKILKVFDSALPGGSSKSCTARGATTVLDCIFSNDNQSFYILDVLHWGDLPLVDTATDFRFFWVKSRLAEMSTSENECIDGLKYPLIPLETYNCSTSELETRMLEYPCFNQNSPKVDGILFYHREAFYSRGETPLVGWLKPFMLPEILGPGCSIANEYYLDRPERYENYSKYMADFDEALKNKWKRSNNTKLIPNPRITELDESEGAQVVEMLEDDKDDSDPEQRHMELVSVELED